MASMENITEEVARRTGDPVAERAYEENLAEVIMLDRKMFYIELSFWGSPFSNRELDQLADATRRAFPELEQVF